MWCGRLMLASNDPESDSGNEKLTKKKVTILHKLFARQVSCIMCHVTLCALWLRPSLAISIKDAEPWLMLRLWLWVDWASIISHMCNGVESSLWLADMSKTTDSLDLEISSAGASLLQTLLLGVVTLSTSCRWNIKRLNTIADTGHDTLIGRQSTNGHQKWNFTKKNLPDSYQVNSGKNCHKKI